MSDDLDFFFDSIKRSLLAKDKGGAPYDLGFDCGVNGPNTTNCSFSIFSRKESTQRWEQGKREGDKARLKSLKATPKEKATGEPQKKFEP